MVYESDFYTTRRPYTRPSVSSYTVSTTPRHYVVVDTPSRSDKQYSYSYTTQSNTSTTRPGSSVLPQTSYSYNTERSTRSTGSGPGAYSYTSESTSRSSDRPGSYSYSSVSSGRLPHGTTYRHYSYR